MLANRIKMIMTLTSSSLVASIPGFSFWVSQSGLLDGSVGGLLSGMFSVGTIAPEVAQGRPLLQSITVVEARGCGVSHGTVQGHLGLGN